MTATLPTDTLVHEALEAEIRQAMARVPRPETCRGWTTAAARRDDLEWIDSLLDRYAVLTWGSAPWRA